jgi:glycosyltransferase involved in cell wall biosynthesis
MKILLTNFRSPWDPLAGGGQAATHDLAQALVTRGHAVTAVFGGDPLPVDSPYAVAWAKPATRPVVVALRIARRVRALARDIAPDVIHASGFEAAFLPRCRVRAMTTHHPDLPLWAPPSWTRPWSRLRYVRWHQVAWLEREGLRKADVAFFVSASAQGRAAARGYRTSRPRVVPNGVDGALFSPARDGRRVEEPTVVFAGRMDDQKGVDVLLRAVSLLSPRPRLRLVGGGWKDAEYRRLAAELGLGERVEFLGQVPRADLPVLLRSASVVAVPSRYENLPLSVLEGMACGVPVVVSRVGGVPEMIDDGVEGTLVPAEVPEALAAALDRLLRDHALAAKMGAAGRRRVLAEFTWESVAARTEACYQELLT